jgi:hydroxymethylpyrimidine/phosphomethylpyrimidine kinase
VKPITKDDAEQIFKFIKLSYGVNEEFAKNITALKNTITDLSHIQVYDPALVKQINDSMNSLTNIAAVIQKTTEYTTMLRNNMNEVSRIGTEINNIKFPDLKILGEMQKTSQMLIETISNLKDSSALKSLDNLVYLAGKR